MILNNYSEPVHENRHDSVMTPSYLLIIVTSNSQRIAKWVKSALTIRDVTRLSIALTKQKKSRAEGCQAQSVVHLYLCLWCSHNLGGFHLLVFVLKRD